VVEQLVVDGMFALAEPQLVEVIQGYHMLLNRVQVIQCELDQSIYALNTQRDMRVVEAQKAEACLVCQRLGGLQEDIQQQVDEVQTAESSIHMCKQQKETFFEALQQARSDGEPEGVAEFRSQMRVAENNVSV